MNPIRGEAVELDEKLWNQWVRKARLRDQERKRKWRILMGCASAVLVSATAIYWWV